MKPGFISVWLLVILIFILMAIFPAVFGILGFAWPGDPPTLGGGIGGTAGAVTGEVPGEYASIFQMAATKFGVQPAFLAAIFYGGEHNNSWPNINGPWASSPKGAQGPFQFMPPTWAGNKQDCSGDGITDVQNIYDAACGAAHLLANIGAGNNTTDLDSLRDAASKYNSGRPWSVAQAFPETRAYVPRVIEAFQKFYSGG